MILRKETADRLQAWNPTAGKPAIAIGFDGYLDQILAAVHTRSDPEHFEKIPTIRAFGERILNAAGKSTNIELVTESWRLGGNGPIMANSMASLGLPVDYVGALGDPSIHEVFQNMPPLCRLTSVDEPGHTQAIEFEDGKIMFGKLAMTGLTWERLAQRLSPERLAEFFGGVSLLGMVNWTQTVHMQSIWHTLLNGFLDRLPFKNSRPYLFVDLADPEKRSPEDVRVLFDQLKGFEKYYRVVLGLNEKESGEVAKVLNLRPLPGDPKAMKQQAKRIREILEISLCVIHPVSFAVCADSQGVVHREGPFESRPLTTTGAGDHFNAGFCLGLVAALPMDHCLTAGVANSGFYVRNARSASLEELIRFLHAWKN